MKCPCWEAHSTRSPHRPLRRGCRASPLLWASRRWRGTWPSWRWDSRGRSPRLLAEQCSRHYSPWSVGATTTDNTNLPPNEPLLSNDGDSEVNVDRQVNDLSVDQGHRDVTVCRHLGETVTEVRQPAHHVTVARGVSDQAVLVSFVQNLHTPLKYRPDHHQLNYWHRVLPQTLRGIHQLLIKTLLDSSGPILEAWSRNWLFNVPAVTSLISPHPLG